MAPLAHIAYKVNQLLLRGPCLCIMSAGRRLQHTSCVTGPDREAAIIWATALYGMKPLWPPIFMSSWLGSSSCRHPTALVCLAGPSNWQAAGRWVPLQQTCTC